MNDYNDSRLAVTALGNAVRYLDGLLLADKTVPLASFHRYEHDSPEGAQLGRGRRMLMDAQALENLEVFEVQGKAGVSTAGSLFSFLDRCSTRFGSRLLRSWVAAPL